MRKSGHHIGLTVPHPLTGAADVRPLPERAGALVAAFPNSGFMGVPLLVALLGLGLLLMHLGLPLAPSTLTVIVLVAALPSASNVSLLAERFGADNGRVARIILVSTAAAFVTFSLAVAWLP